jgi:hypothetical protein
MMATSKDGHQVLEWPSTQGNPRIQHQFHVASTHAGALQRPTKTKNRQPVDKVEELHGPRGTEELRNREQTHISSDLQPKVCDILLIAAGIQAWIGLLFVLSC